jgi:hypothetical protein
MIDKHSTSKDILDFKIANTTVREIVGMSFMAWILNKINGAPVYKAATQELLALSKNPPMGRIPDEEKVRLVRKLLELDITL